MLKTVQDLFASQAGRDGPVWHAGAEPEYLMELMLQ